MSNNYLSQQLSVSNNEMGQIEPYLRELSSPISNVGTGTIGSMYNNYGSQQCVMSDKQMEALESISYDPTLHSVPVSSKQMTEVGPNMSIMSSQQSLMANQQVRKMESLLNFGSERSVAQSMSNSYVPPQLSIPNQHLQHMDSMLNSPGLLQRSTPTKRKSLQIQSIPGNPGLQNLPASNKKMARNESMSGRSGSQQTPKGRNAQTVSSSKVQTESFESVRSKMRETLAAALASVPQNQDKTSNEEKSSQGEAATSSQLTQEDARVADSTPVPGSAEHVQEPLVTVLPSKESPNNGQGTTLETGIKESMRGEDITFTDNFFIKDDFLQGNGLLWAVEPIVDADVAKEGQTAKKPKLVHEDVGGEKGEQVVQSPEILAFKIESELFKLFGGVNKKYKEKGRSLMFNLKDRSNPELRERVISGELSPERLCAMSAEELASKELSQWRMAKAEELAQMIVLPDSDVDVRRLVKKTHKGEVQVEVEQDDGVSVEVSVGTTSLTRIMSKKKEKEAKTSSKSDEGKGKDSIEGEKGSSGNQDLSSSLTIPNDGSELLQGLMADDFKDAEFLPPIVSLDEFMESLDSEPPFENLPVDAGKTLPLSDKKDSEASHELVTSDLVSKDPADRTPEKAEKQDFKEKAEKLDMKEKTSWSPVELKPSPHGGASQLDMKEKSSRSPVEKLSPHGGASQLWEGVLQLNISAMVTAICLFRSGEKTLTKEWLSSLEIKGRVRLDAFEKFLQELPMSRSRAVMITQFVLKDGSSENDRASLCEAVDSYVLDERLGFAEPAPGVEIYFCPPRTKTIELLGKHLPKDFTEMLKSIDSGLIGVVVWRRAHLSSTISPNSHSHNKHFPKKQQNFSSSSRRHLERDTNMNVNEFSLNHHHHHHRPVVSSYMNTQVQADDDDDDDDIPPGFGPRDDDDLPEFNFSGGLNPRPVSQSQKLGTNPTRNPSVPVDHVRELIHKYGQSGTNLSSGHVFDRSVVGIKSWHDDDDDDDIPEWQPQAPPQHPHPQPVRHNFQRPMLAQVQPVNHMVQPINATPGGWMAHQSVPPNDMRRMSFVGHPGGGGQYQGVPLPYGQPGLERRHDVRRSRGF